MLLLGWLVCAKRPLKWHEIQGAKAINLEHSTIEWDRRKLQVDPKDLCGSLVEVRSDQTVEFVHLTVKLWVYIFQRLSPTNLNYLSFLIEERLVSIPTEEIKLGNLCINYLNLPGFNKENINQSILSGYYAFMEYAIAFWVRHLEAGLLAIEEQQEKFNETDLMDEFSESLDCFLETHWTSPTAPLAISKRNSDRLQHFQEASFFENLAQAVVSTRKQLTWYGKMKTEEIALDLSEILRYVRDAFETLISQLMSNSDRDRIEEMYGTNLYKCSRFSCNNFSNGFPTAYERDQHTEKHDRPYRCTVIGCPTVHFGLTTQKELEKHMKDTHSTVADRDEEFPAEIDLAPVREIPRPAPQPSVPKVREKKTFVCRTCAKVFTRQYNLDSHSATHDTQKPFRCDHCPQRFSRLHDRRRHENTHTGEKFICGSRTQDGRLLWGCGKEFTRADSLKNHYKSKAGEHCRLPSLQEQEPEQENGSAGNPGSQNENVVGMVDGFT